MTNDLKFSGVAQVVINYNGSADDVYAPVRGSSCDIDIVSDQILDDLYTARKDEVCVKIEKKVPKTVTNIIVSDEGSVLTVNEAYDANNLFTIYQTTQFVEMGQLFIFTGKIKDSNNHIEDAVLSFDKGTHKWHIDNYFMLEPGEQLFPAYYPSGDDFDESTYKTYYDGTRHYIKKMDDDTWMWGQAQAYNYMDNGTLYDMAYSAKNIFCVRTGNGDLISQLVFNKSRFSWDETNMRWNKEADLTDKDGGSFFSTAGEYYWRIVNRKTRKAMDCLIVNGYTNTGVPLSNWIVELDENNLSSFRRVIKFKDGWDDLDHLFVDSLNNGDIYYLTPAGEIYYWSWEAEDWIKWIQFSGTAESGSFDLDYYVSGHYIQPEPGEPIITPFQVVVKYYDTSTSDWKFFYLYNFWPPKFTVEKHIIPGEFTEKVVWEGYKMPNTYSQDVTQNLDQISMTAIDPVSILKYVTIDKIMTKPALVTYKDLIGAALSYVMLDSDRVFVEQSVSYGGVYVNDNGLMDLKCQIANFWDESDKPSTLYEVIEEMLRPFCMTLAFAGDSYWIYNQSKTTGSRMFTEYQLDVTGQMTYVGEDDHTPMVYEMDREWKSNNTQPATIQINATYDKVTSTASTMVPNYSKMAIDLVDYTQRDKYDAGWMNVQRNKVKGYTKRNGAVTTDTADHWFYIWNGVYVNPDYDLVPWTYQPGDEVEWYRNINKMYEYLESQYTSYGADYGSILNFYGGQNNPTGTGKEQTTEKSVSIRKRITAYAADNGFPPELLEFSDLDWTGHVSGGELTLQKQNTSNDKFGSGIAMGDSNRVVYHQMYENIYLNSINNPTLNLDITRSFSRTGIDIDIEPLNYNTADNVTYTLGGNLSSCDTNYLPQPWNASQIEVNSIYFRRYSSGSTIRVTPVWDRRRIDMYVKLSDNTVIQFNGKEWVNAANVDANNTFYLLKLMNNQHLFHTDHRYDVIETSDGQHYSLTDEDFTYYTDNNGGVYPDEHGTAHTCSRYKSGLNYWEYNVDSCSAGQMSIILPQVEDPAAVVYVDVYNSSMLGMTGSDDIGGAFTGQPFYYALGSGEFTGNVYINFLPKNLSHVKAEHLDLNISISVPESNLGQMFSKSDIRYELDSNSNYVEEFETPSFQVNTYNQLVTSSFSYLIFDSSLADPGSFIINGYAARPECYTVQAYMNWLGRIRKIYTKTIKPLDKELEMNNIMKYIYSPEIGENNLLVISDSWDLKSNRHSITAIEDHNWDVDYVQTQDAVEIPRKARAERWNLPTATK